MNEAIIKEVKSIYSNKIRNNNPNMPEFDIEQDLQKSNEQKTFFNGVIEKLNIIVDRDN